MTQGEAVFILRALLSELDNPCAVGLRENVSPDETEALRLLLAAHSESWDKAPKPDEGRIA